MDPTGPDPDADFDLEPASKFKNTVCRSRALVG
jgi:hypothetical protein